jgi:predicted phosphodiesterase
MSTTGLPKARVLPPRPKVIDKQCSHTILNADYFSFLKKYSTNESHSDKNRYQKVKISSVDRFEDCVLTVGEKITEEGPALFCAPVDGVDDVLSAYANISKAKKDFYSIFFDINPYKIDYFTFRLFLTQISTTKEEYLRNLFFYMEGNPEMDVSQLLDKVARNSVTKELHADYLTLLFRQRNPKLLKDVKGYVNKGVEILNSMREGTLRYRSLAKMLKQNMQLNPTTHWLSDDKLYAAVRDACGKGLIKALQADLNKQGKARIIELINDTGIIPSVIYIPKGGRKFFGCKELVDRFSTCIDTLPPESPGEKYRVWSVMDPERFFLTPQFQHQGELSSRQLMLLTEEYKKRTHVSRKFDTACNLLLLGDVPFGRLYLDERSNRFMKRIQEYANRYEVSHIALCGDILDGEHAREKRKLALLQYLSDTPQPSIEEQCRMAAQFISGFKGKVYSVASDGDWDIIEEKQREILNQKEFQFKTEKNTSHIPDDVKKSLRVEAIFEAAKEYYDYVERQLGLGEIMGDSLNLRFDTTDVDITHMSLGQYFRRSISKQPGIREQQIMNQFLAAHDSSSSDDIRIKVSSHDNVLQASMENEKTLNIRVPSLESPEHYETIPIQMRNAVQDMMHKAFSVRGKIPFLSSCKVEVTKDSRIILTVLNEKILSMLDKHEGMPVEEYLVFNLADAQIGSIAYRYDYLIKYLDYVKTLSEKLRQKANMKHVGRIALFNGDIIEGINYPTAMMRNSPTKLVMPQTQVNYCIELIKPFFFKEKEGRLRIDEDIDHIILTHGNHEYNSGFIHSGMTATQAILQYFKGHLEQEYDDESVRKKIMYSLFANLDNNKMLFSSIGAFSKLGLNIHCMHTYGGTPNIATATPPQEKWVTRIGNLAKPWDVLIQGHYHKFSLGEIAGKVLVTFPSFTEVSDFEYERGLNSTVCGTILHLSSRYGLVVEILTREFLDCYKCQHKIFEKMTLKEFHNKCVEKAIEPSDLTGFK